MTTRGQAQPKAKPRRKRWWLIALAILIGLIGGYSLYAKLSQPPMVKVVWEHEFSADDNPSCLHLQPDGGIAVINRHAMFMFDQTGFEVGSAIDANDKFGASFAGTSFADDQGNLYFSNPTTLYSYSPDGRKRWEAVLPQLDPSSNTRLALMNVIDDGVLVATTTSELLKYDFNGNLVYEKLSPTKLRFFAKPVELPGGNFAVISLPPRNSNRAPSPHVVMVAILDSDLNLIWDSTTLGSRINTMQVFGDQVVFSMLGDHVYAVDEQGISQWEYSNPDPLYYGLTSHNYGFYPVDDQHLLIVSEARVVMVDREGQFVRESLGKYFGSAGIDSLDAQYLIEYDWSLSQGETRGKIGQFLLQLQLQYFPSTIGKLYLPEADSTLVRMENGKITRRWTTPKGVSEILGPGPDGEFYLYRRTMDGGTLYCVRLD